MKDIEKKALKKFLRYAAIDTQSDPNSKTCPTTEKQFNLAKLLTTELQEMGIENAEVDKHCYVYAEIPSNMPEGEEVPKIGFIAHVDTSPDTSGKNVTPNIIENYAGGDIVLPGDTNVVIKDNSLENPRLKECIGDTIITSDGTTLLGADDKAGCAAIMALAEFLVENPDFKHGPIGIAFTPDEEVGRGADKFDVEKFGCEYAYTVDGEMPGEINKETFSADSCTVIARGRDIHPGFAKDRMVNSLRAVAEIAAALPRVIGPESTDGRQPYIHPHKIDATVAESKLELLFRDFETAGLENLKLIVEDIVKQVRKKHPKTEIEVIVKESYRNMADKLAEKPKGLEYLYRAAEKVGANPYWNPIRGGTDGARLTFMGLPCPNIYAGGQNFHSKTEWLSLRGLKLSVETLIELTAIWTDNR